MAKEVNGCTLEDNDSDSQHRVGDWTNQRLD